MKTEERLDLLREKLVEKDFLSMKGLGNEVPYYIFDYPPREELLVREAVMQMSTDLRNQEIHVEVINLFNIAISTIESKIPHNKLVEYEKKQGSDELLKKLRPVLSSSLIIKKITESVHPETNIVFLIGVGTVWPLLRSHNVLNNLQPALSKKPVVLFYPGHYTKYDLSLFGKLKDGNYYRAFRIIDYEEKQQETTR